METKKVWSQQADTYWLRSLGVNHTLLPNQSYTLEVDQYDNIYLREYQKQFSFDYKLYGLETSLINRVVKTAKEVPGNLGILLNGLRGTGKTVTAKQICNELGLPVILVDRFIEEGHRFINQIPQDIIVFIDEYEKIFEENHQLLSIMDGAMNSDYKRIFVLTTNELYISENLIQRPGRIRYLKTFKDLKKEAIEEIVDDCLENKELRSEVINFIARLEMITVDVVKTICQEVNVHGEGPESFEGVFNVRRVSGKFDIFMFDEKLGVPLTGVPLFSAVKVEPMEDFDEEVAFYINGDRIGRITEVHGDDLIKVQIDSWTYDLNRSHFKLLGKNIEKYRYDKPDDQDGGIVLNTMPSPTPSSKRGRGQSAKQKDKDKEFRIKTEFLLKLERAESYHRMYRWPVY